MYAPFLLDGFVSGNGKTAAGHQFVLPAGKQTARALTVTLGVMRCRFVMVMIDGGGL
jgi:hypothetical protein